MQTFRDPVLQKQGLLKLPPEILQDIFASALAENEPVLAKQDPNNYAHIFYEKRNLAVRGLGISCLQIYLNIAKYQLFYANNMFKFDQIKTALCWLHRRTHEERQALKSLCIAYGGLHQEATIQMLHKLPSLSSLALDISPLIQGNCNRDTFMHRSGRPTIQARNDLAALLGDVEFPGLQEFLALSTLKNLSFNLDILSRRENAATRNKVFLIYYAEATCFAPLRNSIGRAILRANVPLLELRAPLEMIDGYLRLVFDLHLDDLCNSWKGLRKVKEEERRARELRVKHKSVQTTFVNHIEQNSFQLPIR